MAESFCSDVELVRCHGGPLSHAALDPAHRTFRAAGIDGLVVFQVACGCAVVLGDPVCAAEQKALLADAFAAHCAEQGWPVLYVAATVALQAIARERGYASIEVARLLTVDPRLDPESNSQGRHLRQHLNHVRRSGVGVREYHGAASPDARLEAQAMAACEQWQAGRRGPQMYLGRPRLFEDKPGRRWFAAEQAGRVVGLLSLLRTGGGDLINLVFSAPGAPPRTNALLVAAALRALREEGAASVCVGVGPLSALGRAEGCGGFAALLARTLYRGMAKLMGLRGKSLFWEKYGAEGEEPLYLLFKPPHIGLREIAALLRAFHFSLAR